MRYDELGEQFLALAGICKSIAALFYAMDEQDGGPGGGDSPDCQHPMNGRLPTTYQGKHGYMCKVCGKIIVDDVEPEV